MDGVLVIDKPEGWTSHDVVAKVRRLSKTKKVGHLRHSRSDRDGRSAASSRPGDAPGAVFREEREGVRGGHPVRLFDNNLRPGRRAHVEDKHPVLDRAVLETLAAQFRGTILQPPPPVSAKKIGGVPAYKLARKNEAVDLAPVEVHIYEFPDPRDR